MIALYFITIYTILNAWQDESSNTLLAHESGNTLLAHESANTLLAHESANTRSTSNKPRADPPGAPFHQLTTEFPEPWRLTP